MRFLIPYTTLCIAAAALVACGKPTPVSPTPSPSPRPMSTAAAGPMASAPAGAASDASLPAAETVLTPAVATKVDPAAGRENKAMTSAQESTAMPLPGQNNDHSAPLPPAKRVNTP